MSIMNPTDGEKVVDARLDGEYLLRKDRPADIMNRYFRRLWVKHTLGPIRKVAARQAKRLRYGTSIKEARPEAA